MYFRGAVFSTASSEKIKFIELWHSSSKQTISVLALIIRLQHYLHILVHMKLSYRREGNDNNIDVAKVHIQGIFIVKQFLSFRSVSTAKMTTTLLVDCLFWNNSIMLWTKLSISTDGSYICCGMEQEQNSVSLFTNKQKSLYILYCIHD